MVLYLPTLAATEGHQGHQESPGPASHPSHQSTEGNLPPPKLLTRAQVGQGSPGLAPSLAWATSHAEGSRHQPPGPWARGHGRWLLLEQFGPVEARGIFQPSQAAGSTCTPLSVRFCTAGTSCQKCPLPQPHPWPASVRPSDPNPSPGGVRVNHLAIAAPPSAWPCCCPGHQPPDPHCASVAPSMKWGR